MGADLSAGREFVLRNARLLDRQRFWWRFDGGSADAVVAALLPYRNEDGGFGNALEPDLRGLASQPVPLEHALAILDEVDRFDDGLVGPACDWLESITREDGGIPFVLPSVTDGPHAPWWEPADASSLNPTAGIAGLLHKHGVDHPWVERATAYCWEALSPGVDSLGGDDAISVLGFLEHVPDRERADAAFERVGARIRDELVALDPATPGYVKGPLEFARHPDRLARSLFDDATIELHLDALEGKQEGDGGWPITWEPPSRAAVCEWRGFVTLMWLDVLAAYGRV